MACYVDSDLVRFTFLCHADPRYALMGIPLNAILISSLGSLFRDRVQKLKVHTKVVPPPPPQKQLHKPINRQ